jgi:A/G-specific adenine glycosylase
MSRTSLSTVSARLERWFRVHARDLPWRRVRTPWTALLSEALLQQTQVARITERFPEFLRRFPTPRAMVRAGELAVLEAWRGLGYYRRARSLHAAAVCIVERHGGQVPSDPEALRALPGVGRYTAGAVASLAFGRREPIVDGNVMRVLARLADRREPVADAAGQAWCWQQAERLVQAAEAPGVTNEAIMELGATLCTPRSPACDHCPLSGQCASRKAGSQSIVPVPRIPPAQRPLVLHALVEIRDGRVALVRKADGLWQGLLVPPCSQAPPSATAAEVVRGLPGMRAGRRLTEVDFATTHRRIRFIVRAARMPATDEFTWVPLSRLRQRAVPAAALRIIEAARQAWPGSC